MAKRSDSADDLLCLTVSQVGLVAPSARQHGTKTPGRPSSSSGLSGRIKPSPKKSKEGLISQTDRARKDFPGGLSVKNGSHSEIGDTHTRTMTDKPSSRSDYLDFFDGPHQPKIIQPKQTLKSNTKNAKFQTKAQGQFTHSIFQPVSARTVSTVEDLELSDSENASNTRNRADLSVKNTNYETLISNSRFSLETVATETRDPEAQNQNCKSDRKTDATQDAASSAQNFKSNGVANNMTSQAMLSGNKAPLRSMENAYQNIKHKTPVNQVRQKTSTNLAEDYIKTCNMSAAKIQRWFRRWRARRQNAEETVKQLLDMKRQERELALAKDKGKDLSRDAERKKAREEKARQARQIAIQDLQKRREEKRQLQHKVAEEEILFLQANGKVSKGSSQKSSNIMKMESSRSNSHQLPRAASNQDLRQRPGSSAGQSAVAGRGSQSQRDSAARFDGGSNGGENDALQGSSVKTDGAESTSSANQIRTKSTIDDILETLKKLEADEESEVAGKKKTSSRLDWLDELDKNEYQSDLVESGPSDEQHQSNTSKDNIAQSGLLSEEKLSSIMNYLEKMEANERLTDIDLELQKVNDTLNKPVLLVPSSEEIAQMELASQTASEVTQQMLKLKLELEDRKRKVQTLEKALNQQRDLTVRYAKETESEMKKRVEAQRKQFDGELSRRNVLIDQLLEDKKQWAEKYDTLQKQLIMVTQTSRDKIKSMEESHAVEVKKLTDLHSATDKLRREKWVKEETRKIKEMTVKGFEPELQRLIAQHKAELNKIKATHQAELLAADERAAQRYVQMTEELRDQLAKEKEAACSRERELARQMYEKQLRQEEEILQQQRQRLYNEVREEKERVAQVAQKQRLDLDRQQQKLEETQSIATETLRKEYELGRKEQESRHATEVRQLKDQLTIEKEAWEENYRKKQETLLMQKEREMREQVKKDRDREIEMAIRSLADDRDAEVRECKKDAENQIRRIREKYERELTELERSERQIAEKYNQTKAKLHEAEGENERLKVTLTQKELHANELKSLLDKRNEERDHISDIIRQEFADRIVAIEDENRRLKNEVSELKARHRLDVERLRSENEVQMKAKEDEMEEVHRRVKEAIAKKDRQSEELVKQREAAIRRADYAEQLLIEQGKKLLGKK